MAPTSHGPKPEPLFPLPILLSMTVGGCLPEDHPLAEPAERCYENDDALALRCASY